jgi:cytidylate kinase
MPVNDIPVLTLDGPSGSGKGTVGQLCAQRLGWHYLDSGAIYRALAVSVARRGISARDADRSLEVARALRIDFRPSPPDGVEVVLDGQVLDAELRTEETGELASRLAAIPVIRGALLELQRRYRREPGLVADGRDMGTVVFPNATLKIFLTASAEVRARRRYKQLKLKGFDVTLAHLFQSIQERDIRDSERNASPLLPAAGAVALDTSDLSIEEVTTRVLDLLQTKLGAERGPTSVTTE